LAAARADLPAAFFVLRFPPFHLSFILPLRPAGAFCRQRPFFSFGNLRRHFLPIPEYSRMSIAQQHTSRCRTVSPKTKPSRKTDTFFGTAALSLYRFICLKRQTPRTFALFPSTASPPLLTKRPPRTPFTGSCAFFPPVPPESLPAACFSTARKQPLLPN